MKKRQQDSRKPRNAASSKRKSQVEKIAAQITKRSRYSEVSTGPEIGKERVDW